MSEILFFSDIHINPHKGKIQRLYDCLDTLQWVFDTARKRQIKKVVFLGDLFQNRQRIDTLSYFRTFEIFKSFSDLDIFVLVGNHDMWFHERWDVTGVAPFSALQNVTLIAEPSTLQVEDLLIDFLPYCRNPIEVIQDKFKEKSRMLCAHIAINDAQLNKLYNVRSEVSVEIEKDMVKVDVDSLDGWEKVFLGHFHGAQKLNDRVEYVGSPLQLSFGEAFQDKHIIILNTDTLECEYVENTFSPKHIIINQNEIDKFDLENNFVIIYTQSIGSSEIIDIRKNILETKKVQHLQFKEVKSHVLEVDREELQGKFDIAKGDVLERYAMAIGIGGLDREKLMELGKDICQGEN